LGLNKSENEVLIPRTVSGPIRPEAGEAAHSAGMERVRQERSRRGGVLTGGSAAGQRQGATGELAGATWRASGKAVGGGAHPSGDMAWRRWRMLRAVAFVGGEGALVAGDDGGTTL
jgi:hypothetical protein